MMNRQLRHNGFSLIEVLMATGILAVGMAMIAMAFPVGVRLASIATERPVGVVAGNEAFAKIRLYSVDNSTPSNLNPRYALNYTFIPTNACMDLPTLQTAAGLQICFLETLEPDNPVKANTIDNSFERFYPSLVPMPDEHRYYWSPLLRRVNNNTNEVQTTVFVCRMLGMGSSYYDMDLPPNNNNNPWPVPVKVRVNYNVPVPNIPPYRITVAANPNFNLMTACRFFTKGCMIVEDRKGHLYKVIETQDVSPIDGIRETLVLDTPFPNKGVADPVFTLPAGITDIWVIPPAVGSSRNPCIDIVQTVMTF